MHEVNAREDYPSTILGGEKGDVSIPISKEAVNIIRSLPDTAQREMVKNVRQYIEQLGKDNGCYQPATNSAIRI